MRARSDAYALSDESSSRRACSLLDIDRCDAVWDGSTVACSTSSPPFLSGSLLRFRMSVTNGAVFGESGLEGAWTDFLSVPWAFIASKSSSMSGTGSSFSIGDSILASVDFTRMKDESPKADGGGVSNDRVRLDRELVPED